MPPYPNSEPLPDDAYPNAVVFEPESPDEERSAQGAVLYGWPEDLRMPMWASVQPATVQETDAQGRLVVTSMYAVHTPTDPGADVQDRFQWDGRTLVVEGRTKNDGGGGQNFITEAKEVS